MKSSPAFLMISFQCFSCVDSGTLSYHCSGGWVSVDWWEGFRVIKGGRRGLSSSVGLLGKQPIFRFFLVVRVYAHSPQVPVVQVR